MSDVMVPLKAMVETTDTDYWNDSCAVSELEYAIANGATGATTNPVIVFNVLQKEMHLWEDRIKQIIRDNPAFTEDEVAWQLIEEMAIKGADLLKPVFDREKGLKGRISIQTNAKFYRNAEAMTEQAVRFSKLAPNMQVKMPVTAAGIKAIEESTYHGVNVNATVSFTVPQSVAVGEAVERGLKRREAEGLSVEGMTPVCTLMVGRLDDWIKAVSERDNIIVDPAYLELCGVAAIKRAHEIYKERGFRTRMLSAAYRNQYHWTELVGDGMLHTIPYKWQVRYNATGIKVSDTTVKPLAPGVVETLLEKFEDFRIAYEPDGMSIDEFENYGATKKTLKQFLGGYAQLLEVVRGFML